MKIKKKDFYKIVDEIIENEILNTSERKEEEFSEEDVESALFYGLNKDVNSEPFRMTQITKNKKIITEAEDIIPSITKSDVNKFNNDFKSQVKNATISFDIQPNGYIINFPKRNEGSEVYASGVADMGRNQKIKFKLSLIDGVRIDTENFMINSDAIDLISNLFTFYTKWKEDWIKILSNARDKASKS